MYLYVYPTGSTADIYLAHGLKFGTRFNSSSEQYYQIILLTLLYVTKVVWHQL